MCNFYVNKGVIAGITYRDAMDSFEEVAYFVNIEDIFDKKNNVSGIDLLKPIPTDVGNYTGFLSKSNCNDTSRYSNPYYCENKSEEIPAWYRRWKDTALVPAMGAYRYRNRWTKSEYDYNKPEPSFFHVPVDQLREFPGFVYHFHIFDH